jgi:hypothetical protein
MRPPAGPLPEARKGILRPLRRDLGIGLRAEEIGVIKWAEDELRDCPISGLMLHYDSGIRVLHSRAGAVGASIGSSPA